MSKPNDYGRRYYRISLVNPEQQDIYAHADTIEVGQTGELILKGIFKHDPNSNTIQLAQLNAIIAPGTWSGVFAASVLDGSPVAFEDFT